MDSRRGRGGLIGDSEYYSKMRYMRISHIYLLEGIFAEIMF